MKAGQSMRRLRQELEKPIEVSDTQPAWTEAWLKVGHKGYRAPENCASSLPWRRGRYHKTIEARLGLYLELLPEAQRHPARMWLQFVAIYAKSTVELHYRLGPLGVWAKRQGRRIWAGGSHFWLKLTGLDKFLGFRL